MAEEKQQKLSNREAAQAVADSPPSLNDWRQGRGRVVPAASYMNHIHRAGWPTATAQVELPQREHSGPRAGQQTQGAAQPVTVVPESWLREMARLTHTPWAEACRFVLPDPPRPRGRPRILPDDATPRNIRMSDAEYSAVVELLEKLRARNSGISGTS